MLMNIYGFFLKLVDYHLCYKEQFKKNSKVKVYPASLAHVYSTVLLLKVRQITGHYSKSLAVFPFQGTNIGISVLF